MLQARSDQRKQWCGFQFCLPRQQGDPGCKAQGSCCNSSNSFDPVVHQICSSRDFLPGLCSALTCELCCVLLSFLCVTVQQLLLTLGLPTLFKRSPCGFGLFHSIYLSFFSNIFFFMPSKQSESSCTIKRQLCVYVCLHVCCTQIITAWRSTACFGWSHLFFTHAITEIHLLYTVIPRILGREEKNSIRCLGGFFFGWFFFFFPCEKTI